MKHNSPLPPFGLAAFLLLSHLLSTSISSSYAANNDDDLSSGNQAESLEHLSQHPEVCYTGDYSLSSRSDSRFPGEDWSWETYFSDEIHFGHFLTLLRAYSSGFAPSTVVKHSRDYFRLDKKEDWIKQLAQCSHNSAGDSPDENDKSDSCINCFCKKVLRKTTTDNQQIATMGNPCSQTHFNNIKGYFLKVLAVELLARQSELNKDLREENKQILEKLEHERILKNSYQESFIHSSGQETSLSKELNELKQQLADKDRKTESYTYSIDEIEAGQLNHGSSGYAPGNNGGSHTRPSTRNGSTRVSTNLNIVRGQSLIKERTRWTGNKSKTADQRKQNKNIENRDQQVTSMKPKVMETRVETPANKRVASMLGQMCSSPNSTLSLQERNKLIGAILRAIDSGCEQQIHEAETDPIGELGNVLKIQFPKLTPYDVFAVLHSIFSKLLAGDTVGYAKFHVFTRRILPKLNIGRDGKHTSTSLLFLSIKNRCTDVTGNLGDQRIPAELVSCYMPNCITPENTNAYNTPDDAARLLNFCICALVNSGRQDELGDDEYNWKTDRNGKPEIRATKRITKSSIPQIIYSSRPK
jgi:hypothetical protein